MAASIVSFSRVVELLAYDPATGAFTWRIARARNLAGAAAGRVERDGYRRIGIDSKLYPAQRLAWLIAHGQPPNGEIDHIDGDRDNNALRNLRDVSMRINRQNQRKAHIDNQSGLLGVSWFAARKKWRAQISVEGKLRFLGSFDDPADAHAAYLAAKRNMHEGCTI